MKINSIFSYQMNKTNNRQLPNNSLAFANANAQAPTISSSSFLTNYAKALIQNKQTSTQNQITDNKDNNVVWKNNLRTK